MPRDRSLCRSCQLRTRYFPTTGPAADRVTAHAHSVFRLRFDGQPAQAERVGFPPPIRRRGPSHGTVSTSAWGRADGIVPHATVFPNASKLAEVHGKPTWYTAVVTNLRRPFRECPICGAFGAPAAFGRYPSRHFSRFQSIPAIPLTTLRERQSRVPPFGPLSRLWPQQPRHWCGDSACAEPASFSRPQS